MNTPLNPMTVFIATPISEKPDKDGFYVHTYSKWFIDVTYWYDKMIGWKSGELDDKQADLNTMGHTHWLKPVTLYAHTHEEMKELAERIWDAGINFFDDLQTKTVDERRKFPDKKTFIDNLLKEMK